MKLFAITTAIVGIALAAPAFAFRDLNDQYQIDKAAQAKQQAALKGGPAGRPGAVQAREGKPGAPCYPQSHPRALGVYSC
jgi:hypothetical protein